MPKLSRRHHLHSRQDMLTTAVLVFGLFLGGYIMTTALAPHVLDLPLIGGHSDRAANDRLRATAAAQGDRLYIPHIGVDVAVVTGDDASVLERGAWHRKPENGNPAQGGNFVLSAHRFQMGWTPQETIVKSPFYHIDKLTTGDLLYVDYQKTRYTYAVTRTYSVEPDRVEIESPSEKAKLTLYTCSLRGAADGRSVVEAVRVGGS